MAYRYGLTSLDVFIPRDWAMLKALRGPLAASSLRICSCTGSVGGRAVGG